MHRQPPEAPKHRDSKTHSPRAEPVSIAISYRFHTAWTLSGPSDRWHTLYPGLAVVRAYGSSCWCQAVPRRAAVPRTGLGAAQRHDKTGSRRPASDPDVETTQSVEHRLGG